jgi:cytochrome P450
MLNSSLPPAEKRLERLVDESEGVVAAGSITTAHVLRTTSFHLLANPGILHKLKTELTSAIPNSGTLIPLQQLEQLPYLSAVVSEGLRISDGASSRLPRVSPDSPIVFREWKIPPGTPMSMTSMFIHKNSRIFPEPHEFRPDRWLQGNPRERLDRYLVPFSKGTRACLGMNLASAEIYITLAAVFREFDMELYETTREDVDTVHDFFISSPRLDSKGVRVLVK